MSRDTTTVIEPKSGWQILNLKELAEFRELFFFMAWRDVKVLYAQTILGFAWAILQPLIQILIFTVVFGKVAKIPTDGIPYILFTTVAIIPWNYMSQAMSASSQSLVTGKAMLGKVYFPRLIFPSIPIVAKLVDFGISMVIVLAVMIYYKVLPTWNLLLLPLFILEMMCLSVGIGAGLAAMAIRFRDVKYAMSFGVRMLMYTAPIVYSASKIPDKYRLIYSLNPVVSVIEGFRSCLLGIPFQWDYIVPGLIIAVLLPIGGAFYFKRMERVFVDVI